MNNHNFYTILKSKSSGERIHNSTAVDEELINGKALINTVSLGSLSKMPNFYIFLINEALRGKFLVNPNQMTLHRNPVFQLLSVTSIELHNI